MLIGLERRSLLSRHDGGKIFYFPFSGLVLSPSETWPLNVVWRCRKTLLFMLLARFVRSAERTLSRDMRSDCNQQLWAAAISSLSASFYNRQETRLVRSRERALGKLWLNENIKASSKRWNTFSVCRAANVEILTRRYSLRSGGVSMIHLFVPLDVRLSGERGWKL